MIESSRIPVDGHHLMGLWLEEEKLHLTFARVPRFHQIFEDEWHEMLESEMSLDATASIALVVARITGLREKSKTDLEAHLDAVSREEGGVNYEGKED